MKSVYIPKISNKFVAPFMYNDGENPKKLLYVNQTNNQCFGKGKGRAEYILGIQTSFGKLGAAVVTKRGEVVGHEALKLFTHRNTEKFVSKIFLKEWFDENLENTVKRAIKTSGVDYRKIKGIAVSLGPGEGYALTPGLEFAQKLGVKHGIPVYGVNNHEAHIFGNRMTNFDRFGYLSPKFPFFSVSRIF